MTTHEWHTDNIRVTYGWHIVRKKKSWPFSNFQIILYSNIWFVKELLACNRCFGSFTKIKDGFRTSFWRTFSVQFFPHKCFLFNTLSMNKCHIFFPSQDIKQNVLLSFYLDNWWLTNCKIYQEEEAGGWRLYPAKVNMIFRHE